jgi:hypothetical protein
MKLLIYPFDDSGNEVAYELDCNDIDISLTLSVQDIQDVTKRRGSFSKTIQLAGTNRNNQAFGHAYNIQSFVGGFTPNKRIRCAMWGDGIQTFSGSLQLLSITKQGGKVMYDVAIFSEEVAFFRKINDTLLIDTAGVSGFNHTLTASLASGTWQAAAGSGYVYGFIDGYGYTDAVPNAFQAIFMSLLVPFQLLTPSFYIKQLVDLIFQQSGYRYQSAFFESDRFKKLVLPYAGGATIQADLSGENSFMEASGLAANGSDWDALGGGFFFGTVPVDTVISDPEVYWDTTDHFFTNQNFYTRWDVRFVCELRNSADLIDIGFAIVDKATGDPLNFVTFVDAFTEQITNGDKIFEHREQLRLAPNQEIEMRIYYQSTGEGFPIELRPASTISMICTENAQSIGSVNMRTALPPDITQADLLRDLQKMFNLYFYQAPEDPSLIYIEPFNDFYASGSVDWTQKIDVNGEQILTMGDPQARKSILFKYKDSGDALGKLYSETFSEGYGSREYQTDNYYAQGEEVVETKCSTVIPASYNSGLVIGRTFGIDSNGNPKQRATGYRIAQYNYVAIPSAAPWIFLIDLTPTVVAVTSVPFISHIDNPYSPTFDLAFGMPKNLYYRAYSDSGFSNYTDTNLFKTYWLNYIEETTSKESLQIELDVMLDPVDIYNLDFRKPIYIDGILFRLLEVRDYVVGGRTKCRATLRRILNLAAPATGAVPILTYFDSSTLVLGEQRPQTVQPNIVT